MTPIYYLPREVLDRAYAYIEQHEATEQDEPRETTEDDFETLRPRTDLTYAERFASIDDASEYFAERYREDDAE